MGTVKVGKSCSRTPRKPESGGESAGNRWKGVETTIRMGTGKVGKSCSRTPRKPESGGESAGNRCKGVEWRRNIAKRQRAEVDTGRNRDSDRYVENGQDECTNGRKNTKQEGREP